MSVYKRGDRWHYRFQAGGQRYSGSAGPGAGKAAAVALEAKMRADLLAGRLGTAPEHSVDEAAQAAWLDACKWMRTASLPDTEGEDEMRGQ